MKKALIMGITGQDGSYLAEILLKKGYEVHGFYRKSATGNKKNIMHLLDKIHLHRGDMLDSTSIYRTVDEVRPDEMYNEADQDHVGWSYDTVDYSFDVTGSAVGRTLEIVRQIDKKIRYFQPVSSNMFGIAKNPQTESTQLNPQSPYGCAKAFSFLLTRYYRNVFGMFASTGIFYNHESPRRTDDYVTRKITKAAARISKGLQKKLVLGDINLEVDFGYAGDFMNAAYNILQLDKPDDFIICSGKLHSIEEWLDESFKAVKLDWKDHVEFDKSLFRPGKTSSLTGDYSKATKAFGYKPSVSFKELVGMMVKQDLKEADEDILLSKPR